MKSRVLLLGLVTLVLFGCSYALKIAVAWNSDGRPSFTVSREITLVNPLGSSGVKLNSFYIFSEVNGVWDYKHPVWSIGLPPGSSKNIKNVLYGEVPIGFEEYSRPVPLIPDVKYQAAAFGSGGGGGVEFSVPR